LVDINEENEIISEVTESLEPRHGDKEDSEIINDGVQELIDQNSPWQMFNGLKLVVDV